MPRSMLSPRWVAVHALALGAVVVMVLLGRWQLDRGLHGHERPARSEPPFVLTATFAPGQPLPERAVGRLTTARGTYDGAHQLLSPGRELAGRTGFWVITPLRFVDGTGVPVVRGWVPTPRDAAPPPAGQVSVTGVLQPSERGADTAPDGQVASVGTDTLEPRFGFPLFDGFVALQQQSPTYDGAPVPVPASSLAPPPARRDLDLRNLAYGVQWFMFAGFAVFLWWRHVRDTRRGPPSPSPPRHDPAPARLDPARKVAP